MEKTIPNILKDKLLEINSALSIHKILNCTEDALMINGNCLYVGDIFKRHYIIELSTVFDTKGYSEKELVRSFREYENTSITLKVPEIPSPVKYTISKSIIHVYKLRESNSKFTCIKANIIFTLIFNKS